MKSGITSDRPWRVVSDTRLFPGRNGTALCVPITLSLRCYKATAESCSISQSWSDI